LQERESRSHTK